MGIVDLEVMTLVWGILITVGACSLVAVGTAVCIFRMVEKRMHPHDWEK